MIFFYIKVISNNDNRKKIIMSKLKIKKSLLFTIKKRAKSIARFHYINLE